MAAMLSDTVPGKPLRVIVYIEAEDVSSSLLDQLTALRERTELDVTLSEELHTHGTLTAGQAML
eukprot:3588204-Amphidinium_carterae.1